jgi:hypothetical protein
MTNPSPEKHRNLQQKSLLVFIVLAALVIVLCGKVPSIGKNFVAVGPSNRISGDLYRLCEVDRFRESIEVLPPAPSAPLEQAEILTLGDSFFNSSLQSDLFAGELAAKSGYAVHNLTDSDFFEPFSYPLAYLKAIGYQPDRRRILILESVERSSHERTTTFESGGGSSANRLNAVAFKLLKNNDVEYFFKNNFVTHPAIKWVKNLRFDWFGSIDKAIGAYSINPDMLFYQRDLDFAARPKPDPVLDRAADRLADLARTLRQRYNLELLYVIVPDKYSVYRDYLSQEKPYDRYIPRLVERLRDRGVPAVDLYSVYRRFRRNDTRPLYFAGDSHYTATGKMVLVDECIRELAEMNVRKRTSVEKPNRNGSRHP